MLLGACSSGGGDRAVALATAALAASDEGRWEDAVAGLSEVIDLQTGDTELLAQAHYNRGSPSVTWDAGKRRSLTTPPRSNSNPTTPTPWPVGAGNSVAPGQAPLSVRVARPIAPSRSGRGLSVFALVSDPRPSLWHSHDATVPHRWGFLPARRGPLVRRRRSPQSRSRRRWPCCRRP
jgi:hypothetical protein